MRLSARKRLLVLSVIFILLVVLLPGEEANDTAETEEKRSFLMFGPEDKPKQFIPMPIFIQNPTLGTGLGLSPMLMFKTDYDDEDSPYSIVAIPFFYTNTQSYFIGAFTSLHFMGDKFRLSGGVGYGRVNNEYVYDNGTLDQEVSFYIGMVRGMYALVPDLYLGGAYSLSYINYIKFDYNTLPIPIDDVFSSGIYLTAQWDNRNSIYNATNGFLGTFEPGFFPTWLGSDSTYITLTYSLNGYQPIVDPLVFAYRVAGSHAFLDAPYSSLPTLGFESDLRGYQAGQYRGDNLITGQVELRWNFAWRLYLTTFGGLGTFYGSEPPPGNMENWDGVLFPSAGFGLSFLTAEETGIMLRSDFAWAKDGDFTWYFQMGNSF
jgi:outer membrane protein assembly factor BamA